MRQKLCGAALLLAAIFTVPMTNTLSQTVELLEIKSSPHECWYLEENQVDERGFASYSLTVLATTPRNALGACLTKMADVPK